MKKQVLYLCHRIPYPPNKGDKIRSFNEVKSLSRKYAVDLITFADTKTDLKHVHDLKKYCRKIKVFYLNATIAKVNGCFSLISGKSITQGYFYNKKFQNKFDQWTDDVNYDAIICFSSPMAEYVFNSKKELQKTQDLIMDFCDLDSDKWLQYANKKSLPASLLYRAEASRLLTFEKKVNKWFDSSIFISKKEAELFRGYHPRARNIKVVPNGVDHEFFDPAQTEDKDHFPSPLIMFSGAMDYYANVDGVAWFAKMVLPEIKKRIPEIKFYIVGSNPSPVVKALETDSAIRVTGFVNDIRPYYKSADLCVIPLRIARGIQNKLLEAMAMELPVVSTSQAIQGLLPGVKKVLEIEDDPKEFASKVIKLLDEKKKSKRLGKTASEFVMANYNWEHNLKKLY